MRAATGSRQSWKAWFIFVCAGIVLAIVCYRLFAGHETLEHAAIRFDDCLQRRDIGCLMRYIPDDEVKAGALTPQSLEKFFAQYYDPKLGQFKATGSLEVKRSESGPLFVSSLRTWARPDGQELPFSFLFFMTDDGPKAEGVMSLFVLMPCFGDLQGEPMPSGETRITTYRNCLADSKSLLASVGIKGYLVQDHSRRELSAFRTIDQTVAYYDKVLADAHANSTPRPSR